MKYITALFVLLRVVVAVTAEEEEYVHFHGQKVVRASLTSDEHVKAVERMNLDVWSRDGFAVIADNNDIRVTDNDMEEFKKMGIEYNVLIDDVEEHVQRGRNEPRSEASPFHNAYHSYNDMIVFIKNLTDTYSKLATFVPTIGTSIEGRSIVAVEITGGKAHTKSIFISGGQHAREWISPATVIYILDQLLTLYGTDPATTTLLDTFSVYIVPVVNPDGYTYTQTNRLWRKNRRLNSGNTYGVDLNRNWNEHWCQYGASTSPSSDTYCGTAPFSEPETKATSEYILKHKHAALIDFHSYGQYILRPYGWTVNPVPPTEALLKSVGDGMATVIRSHGGKVYTSEHGADLYPASGAADDWSFVVGGIPLVYTLELRDTGTYGFQLPANQIVATGVEAYAAFQYLSTRA